jgi:hypothetical protein
MRHTLGKNIDDEDDEYERRRTEELRKHIRQPSTNQNYETYASKAPLRHSR